MDQLLHCTFDANLLTKLHKLIAAVQTHHSIAPLCDKMMSSTHTLPPWNSANTHRDDQAHYAQDGQPFHFTSCCSRGNAVVEHPRTLPGPCPKHVLPGSNQIDLLLPHTVSYAQFTPATMLTAPVHANNPPHHPSLTLTIRFHPPIHSLWPSSAKSGRMSSSLPSPAKVNRPNKQNSHGSKPFCCRLKQ